jgi:ribosomal-protein-alanine N-acetyltransferase
VTLLTSFNIRTLEPTDGEALLAFETRNRAWFESQIDPREASFYSKSGIAAHIDEYLSGLASGTWHPFTIEGEREGIVGRANLKNINAREASAEVGYRVGQCFCGQGLATLAVQHLIVEARSRWRLRQLVAIVYRDNVGSRKVLERCGFVLADGTKEGIDEYRLVL